MLESELEGGFFLVTECVGRKVLDSLVWIFCCTFYPVLFYEKIVILLVVPLLDKHTFCFVEPLYASTQD